MTNTTNTERLKPCPFCGAGNTEIRQNGRTWTGMKFSDPVSVSVRHWCAEVHGQPTRMIERAGRDEESAIAAWNTRAALAEAEANVQAVPQGWKLVPVEPTKEMAQALIDYKGDEEMRWPRNVSPNFALAAYRIMLAASPEAPATAMAQVPQRCDTPRYCTSVQRCTADDGRRAAAPETPPAPYYISGPYDDGSYSMCEVGSARIVFRTGKAEPDGAYNKIDKFLRNNLDDADYGEYSKALDAVFAAHPPAPREPLTADEVRARFDLPFISDEKAEQISAVLVGLCIGADRAPLTQPRQSCEWSEYGGDETGAWHTGCGQSFVFMDGGPKENSAEWCQYCGGRLSIGTDREGG